MNRVIPFAIPFAFASVFTLVACGDPVAYCDEARHQCETLQDALCEKAQQCGVGRDACLAEERSRLECAVVEDWTGEVADCSPVIADATCDDFLSSNPIWVHADECTAMTFTPGDGTCGGLKETGSGDDDGSSPIDGNDDGGGAQEQCGGAPQSCFSASNSGTCSTILGCFFDGNTCTGLPTSCESMDSSNCLIQPGCSLSG